ncbi:MAG: acyl-CoA dehydrogenase [Janthinobacterium lividum]
MPLPGNGKTAERHLRLFEVAKQDVSLAKLAEAHWDALAILAEAGRSPVHGALYAVWASEISGKPLTVVDKRVSGEKAFCTGFGLVQRALVTIGADDGRLLDVDVRPGPAIRASAAQWQTEAFRLTNTGSVRFDELGIDDHASIGARGSYLSRPGFWHGACGPAACWAGGAAGLLAFADASGSGDPHTLAHLAAMHANVWAMRSLLQTAGEEIDAQPDDVLAAQRRALTVRHLIEQLATDLLRRFARAYGPVPLAMHEQIARRYQEVDLFLRQAHGERDLESLARLIQTKRSAG